MTLHKLLQFAKITRPIITLAGSQHTRREHARRKPIPPCQLVHEVAKQQRNFFFALAQGGDVDGKRAQAIVEIFPQLAFRHRLFQIAAGGSQNTDLHFDSTLAIRLDKIPFLQSSQQLELRTRWHFCDFIQE